MPDALAVAWRQAVPVPPDTQQFCEFASVLGWLPDRALPGFPLAVPALPGPE